VPVPDWVKVGIDAWKVTAGITTGTLLRSINKAGRVWGNGFSPKVVWGVVKQKAKACGIPCLAPHDLSVHAPVCAIKQVGSWSKFSFYWDTFPCRQLSAT